MTAHSEDAYLREVMSKRAAIRMAVVGIGGCGCNTITNLELAGVEVPTIAVDMDAVSLHKTKAKHKILVGEATTRGRGSGGLLPLGRKVMTDEVGKVANLLEDVELVIVTAGLGGGTGSGGIAALLEYMDENMKDKLVWSMVTLPFESEGSERAENARTALKEVLELSDMTIVHSNDVLKAKARQASIIQAFKRMDQVLTNAITGLIRLQGAEPVPGLISIDFSNIERVTRDSGLGFVGVGEGRDTLTAFENSLQENYVEADITNAQGAVTLIEARKAVLSTGGVEEIPRILKERYGITTIYFGVRPDWTLHLPKVTLITSGIRSKLVDNYLRGA
ncbi:hypothetical protein DRO48_00260 [Candidatus Bathyarchaeota archaeon]|nr:MAG: hypothetical protein DRO48_00260 [Candidatus Bathyarchaeota archaeon]